MRSASVRTFHADEFSPADLVDAKGATTVSLCLPARNEESTVGLIVDEIRHALIDSIPLVDEILVVDDHSSDDTAGVARAAGARVVDASEVLVGYGKGHGKGEALWKSLHEARGDVIGWVDADIREFDAKFVVGLLGPLLLDPTVDFVKGFYERPELAGIGGGRVTELAARPLLSMFFPELTSVFQPLGGEYAGRRSVLEQLPFVVGYGVDVALLIDIARRCGVERIAQVDLGVRHHRNRSLAELGPQSYAVISAILGRAGVDVMSEHLLYRPDGATPIVIDERPPIAQVRLNGAA